MSLTPSKTELLPDALRRHARERPDAVALIVPGPPGGATDFISFGQLAHGVEQFANMLRDLRRHDQTAERLVPLLMAKSSSLIAAMLALLAVGGGFAVLNRKLRRPQINAILAQLGRPLTGFVDAASADLIAKDKTDHSAIDLLSWTVVPSIRDLPATRDVTETPSFDPRSTAGCCLFTSGSTGTPKGVLISHADLAARARAEVEAFALTPADVLLNVLPLSFDVGLNQLLTAISVGCSLVLSEAWMPAELLKLAASFNVTGISAVPAIWSDLLNTPLRFEPVGQHRAMRYITVSGGDLPTPRLRSLAAAVAPISIIKTYGQSETFRSTLLHAEDFDGHAHTVGKTFGDANVYIVNERGERCGPNVAGEIVHTGLGTMLGYLDDKTDRDKRRPNPFVSDTDTNEFAIFTGDRGSVDADGFLTVLGREDAMLKVAGNRVYPREIADQILTLPIVSEVEVIGVSDANGQTQVVAFIVLRDEATVDALQFRRELSSRLPTYMVPRKIELLAAIPRTLSGKPDRPALLSRLNPQPV